MSWKAFSLALLVASLQGQSLPPLPFLEREPCIDGFLDPDLERLPVALLKTVDGKAQARARLGYGASFLYLCVEWEGREIQCRDRAYQNGDGLILVLAHPKADGSPTDAFRVLGFSPQPPGKRDRSHAFTWYRDKQLVFEALPGARFEAGSRNGKATFELRLPWDAVRPYHPWLGEVGLNLCLVQALPQGGKQSFFLLKDDRIQWEQNPRRCIPARFQETPAGCSLGAAGLVRSHLECGGRAELKLCGGQGFAEALVFDAEGRLVLSDSFERSGRATRELRTEHLAPGSYHLELRAEGWSSQGWFTILPNFDASRARRELEALSSLAPASRTTLAFRLQEIAAQRADLKPWDTAESLRHAMTDFEASLAQARSGWDSVAKAEGTQRRAYRSRLDGALVPYTLRLPQGMKGGEKRPLVVYLHGSGQDDRGQLDKSRGPEGWIQVAVNGRGVSNCYSSPEALSDVKEVLEEVKALCPVDERRIFLAGFSMGGYGTYRLAQENPGLFRGLAVFSGDPSLGRKWLGKGHPDFLQPGMAQAFRGLDLFVFHGSADLNCPFEATREFVQRLRESGARVEFVVGDGLGHGSLPPAVETRYFRWLEALANQERSASGEPRRASFVQHPAQ